MRAATADPHRCCQRHSLAACKHDACKHDGSIPDDPGAHGLNRGKQSKLNGGKLLRRAVGMAWQRQAGTQPAEQTTAGGHSRRTLRPAQASKKQRPADGRPRSKATAAHKVGWPLAVQCRLMGGVQWCWQPGRWAQTYLSCLYPTYCLCLSLSLPTPLICKNPI